MSISIYLRPNIHQNGPKILWIKVLLKSLVIFIKSLVFTYYRLVGCALGRGFTLGPIVDEAQAPPIWTNGVA